MIFDPEYEVTSLHELREMWGRPRPAQLAKCLDRLDDHCRRWIAASPWAVLCSADAQGRMDVSPKGDPAGFVRVLDDQTIAVPDRPGNKRFDTFQNILQNPRVALMLLVPGREEVLRIGGTAHIVRDPDLLASMAVKGRPATLAVVVEVQEVMFHCGKSMIRSRLWHPADWPSVEGLASYAQCLADQTPADESVAEMESRFASWQDGSELY